MIVHKIAKQITITLLFACFLNSIAFAQSISKSAVEKRKAEELWEKMITAKGGLDKLHSITSMVIERSTRLFLDVFPDQYFAYWSEDFSGKPITDGEIYEGKKMVSYSVNEKGVQQPSPVKSLNWLIADRVAFLLETKWNKPELIRVTKVKNGFRKRDKVEAIISGQRMDFIVDPKNHLVSEVVFYFDDGKVWQTYLFSDYAAIDGIMMPKKWDLKQTGLSELIRKLARPDDIKFSFNVPFDPDFFRAS